MQQSQESDEYILRFQEMIEDRIKAKFFASWKKHAQRQKEKVNIVKLMLDYEKQYIIKMKVVVLCIERPIRQSELIFQRKVDYIFGVIPQIIDLHTKFTQYIQKFIQSNQRQKKQMKENQVYEEEEEEKILFSQALRVLIPNLAIYSDYISRLTKISKHLQDFHKEHPEMMKKIQMNLSYRQISEFFHPPISQIITYRYHLENYLQLYHQDQQNQEYLQCLKFFNIYKQFLDQIQSLITENELDSTMTSVISKKFPKLLKDRKKISVKCQADVIIHQKNGKILLIVYEEGLYLYVIKNSTQLTSKNNHILITLNFLSVLKILPPSISSKKQNLIKTLICGADNALNISFKNKRDIDDFIQKFNFLISGFACNKKIQAGNHLQQLNRKFCHPYEKPMHPYNFNNVVFTLHGFTNHQNIYDTRQYLIKVELTNFDKFSQLVHLKYSQISALDIYVKKALIIDIDAGIGFLDEISLSHEEIEEYKCSRILQFLNKTIRHPNFIKNPQYFFNMLKISQGTWRLINEDNFLSVQNHMFSKSSSKCQCSQCLTSLFLKKISQANGCLEVYQILMDFQQYCLKVLNQNIPEQVSAKNVRKTVQGNSSVLEKKIIQQVNKRVNQSKHFYQQSDRDDRSYLNPASQLVNMNAPDLPICPRLFLSIHQKFIESYQYQFANLSPIKTRISNKDIPSPNKQLQKRSKFQYSRGKNYQAKLLYSTLSFKYISSWAINPFYKKGYRQKILIRVFDFRRNSETLEFEHIYKQQTVGYLLERVKRMVLIQFMKDYAVCSMDIETGNVISYYDENQYLEDILNTQSLLEDSKKRIFAVTKFFKFSLNIEMGLLLQQHPQKEKQLIFNEKTLQMLAGIIIERVKNKTISLSSEQMLLYLTIICLQFISPQNPYNFYASKNLLHRYVHPSSYSIVNDEFARQIQKKVKDQFISEERGTTFQENFQHFMAIFCHKDEWITDYFQVKLVIEQKQETFKEINVLRNSVKQQRPSISTNQSISSIEFNSQLFNEIQMKQRRKDSSKDGQFVKMGINYKQIIFYWQKEKQNLKEKIAHEQYQIDISGPYLSIKVKIAGQQILLNVRCENSFMLFKKIRVYKNMNTK